MNDLNARSNESQIETLRLSWLEALAEESMAYQLKFKSPTDLGLETLCDLARLITDTRKATYFGLRYGR